MSQFTIIFLSLAIAFAALAGISGEPSMVGASIPGVLIALAGLVGIGQGLARARLEMTPDSIWVFRRRGAAGVGYDKYRLDYQP